jgi:amidohydrolase
MLAHVLHALYAIPSRRINPLHTSVVSVGQVHAGQASNVIPNELYLNGTLRSYNAEVRQQLRVEVENALRLSEQFGGSYELRISEGCPALFNHGEVNEWLRTAARRFVGQSRTRDHMFGLGYEDFAYMAQTVPGAMFGLGASLNDGRRHAHHTSTFDIDERVLPLGCAILAETARQFVTGTVRASWLKA